MYKSEFRQFLIYYKRLTSLLKENYPTEDYERIYISAGRVMGVSGVSGGEVSDITEQVLKILLPDDIIF